MVYYIIFGMIGAILIAAVLFLAFRSNNAIVLKKAMSAEDGYSSISDNTKKLINAKGKAVTSMTPSGIIEIEGIRIDAQSTGEFIDKGELVQIIGFDSVTPVVKKIES